MMKHALFNFPRRSKGAGLLEVMVAAGILGLGLLGVAALQMTALKGAATAQHRIRATDLAASMADRIRANLTMDNNYDSGVATNCNVPAQRCASTPDGATSADACTQAQMATYDLWEIRCQNGVRPDGVGQFLPGGTLTVECTDNDSDTADGDACTPGTVFQITVNWEDGINPDTNAVITRSVVIDFIPGS
ncbi:MAG: type IV pilus modification protein PilV [Gammaproteobacteria bacterium]|nr:type IV pilus modification protein PilV [Gammaproteobacteria bacterium]